jgi:death-on-curing protein
VSEVQFQFLNVEDVLELHEMQLKAFGGSSGIRDRGLLESAVAMPEASYGGEYVHEDLYEMAAAYAFHLAENQPFLDGNKRTALHAALMFLDLNGYEVDDPAGDLYVAMIGLAEKTTTKEILATLLKRISFPA